MRLLIAAATRRLPLMAGLLAATGLAPAAANAPAPLGMLSALDKGMWEVRYRDGGAGRRLCVHSGLELIQLKHTAPGCSRFVIEDEATAVTVQYACRGDGYGRTRIRRETASLVQIESQGIAGGMPFDVTAEARRTGPCP